MARTSSSPRRARPPAAARRTTFRPPEPAADGDVERLAALVGAGPCQPPERVPPARAAPATHGLAAGEIARRDRDRAQHACPRNLGVLTQARAHRPRAGTAASIIYTADYARMRELLGFLIEDCCGGRAESARRWRRSPPARPAARPVEQDGRAGRDGMTIARRLAAEALGTALLLATSSSARGSWASASPAGMSRSPCSATRSPRGPGSSS